MTHKKGLGNVVAKLSVACETKLTQIWKCSAYIRYFIAAHVEVILRKLVDIMQAERFKCRSEASQFTEKVNVWFEAE
jgi:hypothetical protein